MIGQFKASVLKKTPDVDAQAGVADLLDALNATIASGKSDAGGSLLLGSKTLVGIVGLYMADTAKIDSAVKRWQLPRPRILKAPKINLNAEKFGDITFHTAKLPVPPTEDIAKVVGGTLDVAVGVGPKSVYLGIGNGSIEGIKKAIDRSKTPAGKPMSVDVVLGQIFDFANALQPNPVTQMASGELTKAAGKDHIRLITQPISNGVTYHLEAQEGVLNLLGIATKMQGGPQGPPPPRRVQ